MNGWVDKDALGRAVTLEQRGEVDTLIGRVARQVAREQGYYDAGFEAGVLATEAGLGRYND